MSPEEFRLRAAKAMAEADLDRDLVDMAKVLRWWTYHTHDSRRSTAGFPDRVLIRGERLVFAELKRQREKPTPVQEDVLARLRLTGVEVYVWRPLDLLDGTIKGVLT